LTAVSQRADEHYENIAGQYDDTWAHRPEYLSWMSDHSARRLDMVPGGQVADIGAGTGLFLGRLAEEASPDKPILCIDPSQPMLDHLPDDPRLQPIRATAEDVAAGRVALPYEQLDGILIKETIHHVTDLAQTMRGLADLLVPGGRILVVSLPPRLEYPLFQAALDRFAANHPEPETIANTMRAAGLETEVSYEEYPITVDRDHWIELMGRQWMSVLHSFSDDEIAAGQDEVRRRHPERELQFVDRFAFVLGIRR
jgi:ubiquinone/menaquinone biosynthesis C-methylase UbiE